MNIELKPVTQLSKMFTLIFKQLTINISLIKYKLIN